MSATPKYIISGVIGSSKVENQLIVLQNELAAIKNEIAELEQQETKLVNDVPSVVYEGNPQRFGIEAKTAAKAMTLQQPQLIFVRDAIAQLQGQLKNKVAALAQLEKEQQHQARLQRLGEGRAVLREKISQVEELAESLTTAYMELKQLQQHYDLDFQHVNPPSVGSRILGRDCLVNFHQVTIPRLFEEGGVFIATSIQFDPYVAERQAQQQAEAVKWAAQISNAETTRNKGEEDRRLARINLELEDLERQLAVKTEELGVAQATKEQWQQDKGSVNFDKINGYLARLNFEVSEIEAKMSALKEEEN